MDTNSYKNGREQDDPLKLEEERNRGHPLEAHKQLSRGDVRTPHWWCRTISCLPLHTKEIQAVMNSRNGILHLPLGPSATVDNQDRSINIIFDRRACTGKAILLKMQSFLARQIFQTIAFKTKIPNTLRAARKDSLQESQSAYKDLDGSGRWSSPTKKAHTWLETGHNTNRWSTDSIPEWQRT